MKRILLVFGTRPEAIKMCPLVKEFQKHPESFETVVCVTGQHREMLDQVLQIFDVKPDYDLNIMKQGQDLYDVTARVLIGMRDVLDTVKPDVVLVHGDTTTSMAAAWRKLFLNVFLSTFLSWLRSFIRISFLSGRAFLSTLFTANTGAVVIAITIMATITLYIVFIIVSFLY